MKKEPKFKNGKEMRREIESLAKRFGKDPLKWAFRKWDRSVTMEKVLRKEQAEIAAALRKLRQ